MNVPPCACLLHGSGAAGEGGGAGLSWVGRASGQDADKSPADPSHGGACRRAGLVQTQRFTQPTGKIHFFALGPLDEGVVLQGKKRCREQPGVCGQEEGTSLPLASSRPSGTKTRKTEREQAPSHRKTHSGRGEKPNPEQGGAMPGALNTWGRVSGEGEAAVSSLEPRSPL